MPTQGKQQPFGIKGTVTVNGSAFQGAKIWVRDLSEGTMPAPIDDHTIIYTDSNGKYIINLSESTSAFAMGDSLRVYCDTGRVLTYDTTTVVKAGYATVNFTIVNKAGMVDGCKPSPLTSGKGTLNRQLIKGCKDGMT